MATLDGPLNQPPEDPTTRSNIIRGFWPSHRRENYQRMDWNPYFRYYARQCHNSLIDQGQHLLARTHQHVLDIVRHLEIDTPRVSIKQTILARIPVRNRPNEEGLLDNTIDLSARLYLMLNIAIEDPNTHVTRQTQLKWTSGTLKESVHDHFCKPQILGNEDIILHRTFNAASLERIAGIRIQPTNNLLDHLRILDAEDKLVAIFHHASFLTQQQSKIYPDGLVEETLRTLSLLFPQNDKETRKWLQGHCEFDRIDQMVRRCDPLALDSRQIEKFRYWHDRIVMLKQAFDESRPSTVSQWWHDRRNGVQWYTFWVAILILCLTIFFGLVQSIEGALQVYKAFQP
ncbi:hypothetical protein B0J11DRAFT_620036 [Dendryphion nanum]|uniref:Uncharacterized protein n=1 Tax=Dendryphion nanum TaxID=256645 RepID=A0A9P9D1U0_9PLEO|nr:hypothetical protein B0J11DRAFT_620036 [Dendryphion nanum]